MNIIGLLVTGPEVALLVKEVYGRRGGHQCTPYHNSVKYFRKRHHQIVPFLRGLPITLRPIAHHKYNVYFVSLNNHLYVSKLAARLNNVSKYHLVTAEVLPPTFVGNHY